MKEFRTSIHNSDSGEPSLEISIKGNADRVIDLKKNAIKSLIKGVDLKIDFEEDSNAFNQFVKDIILDATDLLGYDEYYWAVTSNEETHYNEYDELVVSKKGKVQLLELIVAELKEEANKTR